MGLTVEPDEMEEEWESVAGILGVTEDYQGFYDESFNFAINRFLEDAVVEVSPRKYLDSEVKDSVVVPTAQDNPVTLLNRSWAAFAAGDIDYQAWEKEAVEIWLS